MTPLPLIVALLAANAAEPALEKALPGLASELVAVHGGPQRPRIERGLRQAASLWRRADGDAAAFRAFARAQGWPNYIQEIIIGAIIVIAVALDRLRHR